MAIGSLKTPFKKKQQEQEDSPLKNTGSNIGSTIGGIAGTAIGGPVGAAIGSTLGGLVGGLFGSKDEEQKPVQTGPTAAEIDLERRLTEYEGAEFKTTNPYGKMTVNLQAAEFQRDQRAQSQADILQSMRGAGGAAGGASLAAAMSRQAGEKERAISADIGRQEQEIQMKYLDQSVANQQAKQQFELDKMSTMLGINMAQVTGEQQGRLAQDQLAAQAEQNRMNNNSAMAGAGLDLAGTVLASGLGDGGFLNS